MPDAGRDTDRCLVLGHNHRGVRADLKKLLKWVDDMILVRSDSDK